MVYSSIYYIILCFILAKYNCNNIFTINTAYKVQTTYSVWRCVLERMLNYIYIIIRKTLYLINMSYKFTNMHFFKKDGAI